jgi:hypothetical protein
MLSSTPTEHVVTTLISTRTEHVVKESGCFNVNVDALLPLEVLLGCYHGKWGPFNH